MTKEKNTGEEDPRITHDCEYCGEMFCKDEIICNIATDRYAHVECAKHNNPHFA